MWFQQSQKLGHHGIGQRFKYRDLHEQAQQARHVSFASRSINVKVQKSLEIPYADPS
jgi:hypothetical protein